MLKKFFSAKSNLVLLLCCLFLLACLGYLGFSLFGRKEIMAIDFSTFSEAEIKEWAADNLDSKLLKIDYAFDETIEKGHVISQSVNNGDVISGVLEIIISSGKDPEREIQLPLIDEKLDFATLDKWFSDNEFKNIEYQYVLKENVPFGRILAYSVSKASRLTKITVTVSTGDQLDNIETVMINLQDYDHKMVNKWASQYALNVKISYRFADVEEGLVVSFSPAEGTVLHGGDEVSVVLSQGQGVMLKNLKGLSKDEAVNWLDNNGLNAVLSSQYSNSVKEGMVISTSPAADYRLSEGSSVKLVISLGEEPFAIIPDNLLGISEKEFLNKLKELGFNNFIKADKKPYSKTIAKDGVYSYDDGKQTLDQNINYSLSAGPYVFVENEYNGKSQEQLNSLIKNYNKLNAQINTEVIYHQKETDQEDLIGKVAACKFADSTITCDYYIRKMVDLPSYVDSKNNPCGSATSCVVGGITYQIQSKYASQEEGVIISQSLAAGKVPSGSEVVLVVSLGKEPEKTAYIISYDDFLSFNTSNSDETITALKGYFNAGGFTNVTYKKVKSDKTVGVIVAVSVNGDSAYNPGQYPLNTPIIVEVCDSRNN